MHATVIIAVFFLALACAGILADVIAPRFPQMLDLIYDILDRIM